MAEKYKGSGIFPSAQDQSEHDQSDRHDHHARHDHCDCYDHRDHHDNHEYLDQCDHQTKTATTTNPSPRRVKLSNELKKSSYQLMLIVEYY